jgi:hypothetical protein
MSDNITTAGSPPLSNSEVLPSRRFRFRFSLATLMFSVTLIIVLVALTTTSLRYHQAMEELLKLRGESGYLTISDPAKIHVIGVRKLEEMKWQWRIYAPEG